MPFAPISSEEEESSSSEQEFTSSEESTSEEWNSTDTSHKTLQVVKIYLSVIWVWIEAFYGWNM